MESPLIACDAGILGGKPCVRGTRISVEHVLELLASGASIEEVLEAHPQLTREGLQAALSYAAGSLRNESVWSLRVPA
jgi:uncharacterized protein (DUF433 family)